MLAFTLLGLACAIAKPFSNKLVGVGVGTPVVCFIRFMCSFLSGVLIWGNLTRPARLDLAWTYNGSHTLPETIMTTIAAVLICCGRSAAVQRTEQLNSFPFSNTAHLLPTAWHRFGGCGTAFALPKCLITQHYPRDI